jgi:hypothetical protein
VGGGGGRGMLIVMYTLKNVVFNSYVYTLCFSAFKHHRSVVCIQETAHALVCLCVYVLYFISFLRNTIFINNYIVSSLCSMCCS